MQNYCRLAAFLVTVLPVSLDASVIYSNITGPSPATGVAICNTTWCGVNISAAEQFTPSATYTMSDAEVVVKSEAGPGTFDVFLYSNQPSFPGPVPGSAIEEIGSGLTAPASDGSVVIANNIATPITLLSGTPYWLVVAPHDADTYVAWEGSGSATVPYARSTGGSWDSSNDNLQFQIDGTLQGSLTVPEPATLVLLTGSLLAFASANWRRRLQSKVDHRRL